MEEVGDYFENRKERAIALRSQEQKKKRRALQNHGKGAKFSEGRTNGQKQRPTRLGRKERNTTVEFKYERRRRINPVRKEEVRKEKPESVRKTGGG